MKNLMILAALTLTSTIASANPVASCVANGVGAETLLISQGLDGNLVGRMIRLYEGKTYNFTGKANVRFFAQKDATGSFGAKSEEVQYNINLMTKFTNKKITSEMVASYTIYSVDLENDTILFLILRDENQKILSSGFRFESMPGRSFFRTCL